MHSTLMCILNLLALGTLLTCTAAGESKAAGALDWITGHWCADSGGEFVEEHWLSSRGGLLLGVGRTVRGGKVVSFEFLRIESNAFVTHYLAQPQGGAPTAFRMTASGADWARFENPDHDFPTRVEYRRTADGLHAEVAGLGKDGKELVIPFEYRACN